MSSTFSIILTELGFTDVRLKVAESEKLESFAVRMGCEICKPDLNILHSPLTSCVTVSETVIYVLVTCGPTSLLPRGAVGAALKSLVAVLSMMDAPLVDAFMLSPLNSLCFVLSLF